MNSESEAERTLRNLMVLSEVKQNDKLITLGDTFAIYPPTVLRGAWRKWQGEARDANIARIQEVINSACTYVTAARDADVGTTDATVLHHQRRRCYRLLDAMQRCRGGLQNLCHTYIDDTSCRVRIELAMQTIDDYLSIATTPVGERAARGVAMDAPTPHRLCVPPPPPELHLPT